MKCNRQFYSTVFSASVCIIGTMSLPACRTLKISNQRIDSSQVKAIPDNRKIIGEPGNYEPIGNVDSQKLKDSIKYRRQVGWEIIAKTIFPKKIKSTDFENQSIQRLPNLDPSVEDTVPTWVSWYSSSEFLRIFQDTYGSDKFGPSRRSKHDSFTDEEIRTAIKQHSKKDLLGWTSKEFEQRLGQFSNLEQLGGLVSQGKTIEEALPGISANGMTVFSPGVVRHLLKNYKNIYDCVGSQSSIEAYNPKGNCYGKKGETKEFPKDAVLVKATWNKITWPFAESAPCDRFVTDPEKNTYEFGISVFDTGPESIAEAIRQGEWVNRMPHLYQPCPSDAFTVSTADGSRYILTGLHVVAKETKDWVWVTLWFSPNQYADEDFGADRPIALDHPNSVWKNYKMCVSGTFEENDKPPYQDLPESLAAATRATFEAQNLHQANGGNYTWCSNPYIEWGKGNSRTNCVGCHQHAGSSISKSEPFQDEKNFPFSGRSRIKQHFPADYLWSLVTGPDYFGQRIHRTVSDTDLNDRLE